MAGIEDIRKAFARAKALNDVPNARRFAQMLVDYAPAPAPKREVGIDEAFGIGFDRGKGRLGSLITDIVPALLGSVVGADEYAQRQLEEAAAKEAALPAPIFESFKDVGGVGDAAKFALETMGEQLPNLAIAVGTGLTGGVAAPVLLGGRAVATKAATEIAKKKALELVAKQTVAGQFAGATFGSYALNAPEVFQNIYQETGETAPGTALLFGLAAASLDSLLPAALARNISAPVKAEVVKKLLLKSGMKPSVLRSGTAGFAKGLGLEGITEGAQEAISIAAERLIDDNPDVFGSKEFDRIMEAGVRGAVAGGGFGTIGGGIEGAREQAARGQRLEELKETRKLRDEFNKKTAEDAALTTSIEEIQNQQAQGDLFGAPVASTLVPLSIPDALTTYESSPAYISELETRTDAGETEEQARTFLLDRKYQELAAIEQDRDTARGQTTRPETPIAEFTREQVLAEAERRTALNSRTDVQKELLKVWAEVRAAKTEAAKTGPALIKKQIEMLTPEGKLTPALERQARVADLAARRQAAADAKAAEQVSKDEAAAVRVADLAARRQAAADAKAEVTRLKTDSKRINNAEQLELNLPEAIPPTQVTGDAGQGDLFAGLPDQTRISLVGNSAFLKTRGLPNNPAALKAIEGLDFSIPEQRERAIQNLDELAKRSTSAKNVNAIQNFIAQMAPPVTSPETPKAVETKAKPATPPAKPGAKRSVLSTRMGKEGETLEVKNPHTVKTLFAAMQEAFPGVYAPLESAGLVRIITSDQIPKSISDRKFSKADIEKLTSERGTSLALFANNFVERIAAKDRTLADANKIATEIVDEAVSSPEKFLPVTTAANIRVIHDRFLKMPDGLSYDPDNLAHANASVETTTIYALRKNESISRYEEEEARRLNNERADALSGLASYLKDNSDYDPSEAATAIALASQYGIRGDKSKDGKIQYRAIEILADNQTPIIVVDGAFAALLVENLRGGMGGKAAVVKSYESMVEKAKAAKDSLSDGLHKFKQSDEESDAVALNKAAYGTPWCTGTAVSTARSQLSGGDFYVYYKEGKPQIAFRLNGQKQLAEPPRGTLPGQGLTAEQTDIADDLLRSGKIPGGEDFLSDQDFIKNVMHNLDKMSDVDVFVNVEAKRKSANGYGQDNKKFPPSIYMALQRESNRRGLNESKGYYDFIRDDITQDQAEQALVVRNTVEYLRNAFTFKRLVYVGNIAHNSGDVSFPVLKTAGDIYSNNRAMSFPVLKTAGDIAYNNGDISFPVLETVRDIYNNGGDISFPVLKTARDIYANRRTMSFPVLKTVENISDNKGDMSFPVLETVRDIDSNNGATSFLALKTAERIGNNGGDISFPVLETVEYIYGNSGDMSFPVLETVRDITRNNGAMSFLALKTAERINNNNGDMSFPVLETVGDIFNNSGDISFPVLKTARSIRSNKSDISFPVLKTAGSIRFNDGDISFPVLETVGDIYDNGGDISFPVLKTARDIIGNRGDMSFPVLKTVEDIYSNNGDMSFPVLETVVGDISSNRGDMSFPALETAGDIYSNSGAMSFPALKIAKNIFSNTGVMSFPALKTVRDKNDILFSADGNILAYVEDGKVVFVADNIPKDHNVRGLMLHEIGVHLRSLGVSDTEFQAILTRLEAARKAGNKAVIAAFDRVPKDTPANLVTEEAAGYLVEMAPESSFARQLLTWIKAKLKAWIRAIAKGRNLMVLTQWANSITQDELVMMATAATSADSSLFNSDADSRSLNVQGEYLNKSQLKAPVYKGVAFDADLKQLAARGRLAPVLNKLIPKQSAEIQRILRKIATQNLRTRIVVGPTPEGSSGVYDPITDVITLDPTLGMNEHTILHEMGHAALAQAVNNPDLQITKDFFKFFSDIKLQMGDAYGGQNLQEFVGELIGNPEFQALLKNIKAPKSESMWKNILDAILKFFTFRKGQSAYNKGLDFIDKLLDVSQGVEPTLTDQLFLGTPAMGVKAIGNIMNSGKKLTGSKIEDLQNALSKLGSTTKGGAILSNALRALRLNDLVKLYGDKIPALERLRDAILERQGATEKARKAVQIKYIKFKKINKKKPAQTAELAEVASEARREGFDLVKVDPEFKVDALSPQQKVKFNKLMVRLRNLDPDVQEMYKDIRADYRRMYDQYKKYVLDQVKDGTKRKELEARFLKETSAPGYVPFLRFGDYFLDYTDAATKTRVVKAFESPRERTNFLEANKSKIQNEKQFDRTANAIFDKKSFPPASFVFQLMEALPPDQQAIVYDQLLTLYPENSFMQRTRAADKVEGESKDLVQGYADTMLKWVTKQSSLEFSPKIQNSLSEIKSAKVTGVEAAVKNEMGRREEFITNPNYGPWTAFFATSAYNLFLTGNISAAIVNLSALVLLSGPLLTGVYGFNKTSAALLKAMAVAKPKFNDWNSDTGAFEAAWTKDPKYKTLVAGLDAKGQREHTLQREILEGSRQSTVEYDAFGARFMNLASVPFTEAEKYSRSTTAIAAYELAKAAGKSDAAAVEEAVQLVMDVHTSGVAAEGPQLMQGSLGRVMFTFKTFVWNSATIVAMTARKAFQKEPSDVRRIARKQLLGIYAMSAAIGGINGLPFYGFLTTLTNMIGALAGAFDDDDEPFNFRDETREFTNEFLYKGPLNYITNLEISNRVGLANGLLFQEDPYSVEQNGYIMTAVMQAMGPVGSYALNIERNAGRLLEQGEYGRFFEAIAPSSLRNIFKTGRYIQEGARTMDGEPIIENINSWNLFMQAFGFGPADLSSLYEVVGGGLNYQSKVRATKQKILKKYYMGITTGDSGLIAEAIQDFTKFGREFPELVNSDTLNRSFKSRQAYERDLVYGMKFDAGLKRKINERYLDEFIEI